LSWQPAGPELAFDFAQATLESALLATLSVVEGYLRGLSAALTPTGVGAVQARTWA